MNTKALTPVQATAVYRAMCELNNIGNTFGEINVPDAGACVRFKHDGTVAVKSNAHAPTVFASQHSFALHYGVEGVAA
jgi:flagellar basal body rod protein FlgF